MDATIIKMGRRLVLEIPPALARKHRLVEGSQVELVMDKHSLLIRAHSKEYSLEELLSRITPETIHAELEW